MRPTTINVWTLSPRCNHRCINRYNLNARENHVVENICKFNKDNIYIWKSRVLKADIKFKRLN
jgi:hypothetical protein